MSFVAAKIQQNCTGTGNYIFKATRQGIICAEHSTRGASLQKQPCNKVMRVRSVDFCDTFFQSFLKISNPLQLKASLDAFAYCTNAIITHSMNIFYPIFHCNLYCRAVYMAEQLIFHDSYLSYILR